MNSSYLIIEDFFIITLSSNDISDDSMVIKLLEILKSKEISKVIVDLSLFEIITTEDIKFIKNSINILKLNNIETIVCNINPYSASILVCFIDGIPFKTSLNIQSAIDDFNNR